MKNKWLSKKFVVTEIVVLILAGIGLYFSGYFTKEELNGNDKESILKTIHSLEGYKEPPVNILDVRDFDEQRVVSFLSGTSPAYILFEKNKDENYKWYCRHRPWKQL